MEKPSKNNTFVETTRTASESGGAVQSPTSVNVPARVEKPATAMASDTTVKKPKKNRRSARKARKPIRRTNGDKAVIYREELETLDTREELLALLRTKKVNVDKVMNILDYEAQLEQLQVELVRLQRWVQDNDRRVAIVFEGRDAAGKGGCIRRFTEHLNPRAMRVVALPKPTDVEKGQWYFQRYSRQLPNPGEIVFFDRSWYNRAVVEPVNGFCTDGEYAQFMRQVPEFEHMLFEDGILMVKFWFSISKGEQLRRFKARAKNPLKQWKLSPIDQKAQGLWDQYTYYKEMMFSQTHTTFSPWIIVKANNKKQARLESIRHVLSAMEYDARESAGVSLQPNPNIVMRFHRSAAQID